MSETLEQRIDRLERVVLALASATQELHGGTCQGAFYTGAMWRDKVLQAVDELRTATTP